MSLEGHAEVLKLARLLDTDPGRLHYLEQLAPGEVRELRERATEVLYERDRRFGRIALASRIPPAAMTAWIAQHLFGALLCARVAGLLDTARAVDLAERMPPDFLADLAMQLDPRRADDIIRGLPPQLIAAVASRLTAREEYIAMGRFVGHMTDDGLRAAFEVIDDASLLRVSYFVEAKDQLDHVVGLLATERVSGAIRAASAADLWPQALDLLTRVSPQRAGALADLAADEDDYVLEGMVQTAQRDGLWDVVLPVTQNMTAAGRQRFASLPALQRPEVIVAIIGAAVAGELWEDLQPLAELMPARAQAVIRGHAPA
ncbi:MAG: hypothetical protein Q8O56_04735 [Solirubrobacteraceae bacterium]|nr:hypothetical protein [Solirubrobacteraceae bacterium]